MVPRQPTGGRLGPGTSGACTHRRGGARRSLATALIAFSLLAVVTVGDARAATGGLVAAYSFDEGSGTTASDASGNGHGGTVAGATWATGKFGSALSFNGTSSHVDLPALG